MTDRPASLGRGVIEGFFGPPWSWENRAHYAAFLKRHDFRFYLFAPKRCEDLRLQWDRPWPRDEWTQLEKLRTTYRDAGIAFGVGLSPFALYCDFNAQARRALAKKIRQLNTLELDILGIFFDDMPEGGPELAHRQVEILSTVKAESQASTLVLCPTFYSDDPVLERLSGPKPPGYLPALGELLDADVHVFWTGPQVCSTEISAAHIVDITRRLGRPPLLWDNYPVNDGPRMSRFLHLRSFSGREELPQALTSGHAVNPMNQVRLSEIPLHSLSTLYRDPVAYDVESMFAESARHLCGDAVGGALIADLERFQDKGLDALSSPEKAELRKRYVGLGGPYAAEVVGWIDGAFAPTPADLEEFGQ